MCTLPKVYDIASEEEEKLESVQVDPEDKEDDDNIIPVSFMHIKREAKYFETTSYNYLLLFKLYLRLVTWHMRRKKN